MLPASTYCTTRVTVTVCCREPLVAVIFTLVYVPLVVRRLVLTVIVVEPEILTDDGLKFALVRFGRPLTLKLTIPLNEPEGVTVTV
jgi:hypothetical protein